MFIADTTFLIDLLADDAGAVRLEHELETADELVATTFVNAYEFLIGNASRPAAERERGQSMLNHLLVLDGDYASALLSAQAGQTLAERGQKVAAIDLLIAGIVMRAGGTLLTRDSDFARIPGLAVKTY